MQTRRSSRQTRSRTATLTELLLIGVFAAAIIVAGAHYLAPAHPEIESTSSIRIGPETTLWHVAQDHPIDGLSTAQTVDVLLSLNELEGASLAVGQTLLVPVMGDSVEAAVASR